ncbi:MAG: hypothetical protein S4CHLAM7_01830 [Chlamydiae bacterium]|nr:hypothetical protein [Chlamydiota bacterium]
MTFERSFRNTLFSLFFLTISIPSLFSSIENVSSFKEIQDTLSKLDSKALVVFDVDEVIFTDEDLILKPQGDPLKFQIFSEYYSKACSEKEKVEISKTLSLPLLKAKKVLTENNIPKIIKKLQEKNIKVIALTSCPTKPFGAIKNFEAWRLNHLAELDIDFEKTFKNLGRFQIDLQKGSRIPKPIFTKGVLFSGGFSKAEVLSTFLKEIKFRPNQIVFVDDSLFNLEQMEVKLLELNIPHFGYFYDQSKNLNEVVDEKRSRFQFEYLFMHKEWLSDKQAKELMETHK